MMELLGAVREKKVQAKGAWRCGTERPGISGGKRGKVSGYEIGGLERASDLW